MLTSATTSFANLKILDAPFRHGSCQQFLPEAASERLLSWFKGKAQFSVACGIDPRTKRDAISLTRERFQAEGLEEILTPRFLLSLYRNMEKAWGEPLGPYFNVLSHRLTGGANLFLHTDYHNVTTDERPNFRFVLTLCDIEAGQEPVGGAMLLFRVDEASRTSKLERGYKLAHNGAFMFKITENSWHAVEPMKQGVRYSMIFTFNHVDVQISERIKSMSFDVRDLARRIAEDDDRLRLH